MAPAASAGSAKKTSTNATPTTVNGHTTSGPSPATNALQHTPKPTGVAAGINGFLSMGGADNAILGGGGADSNSRPGPSSTSGVDWDGDHMLHVYIVDYCRKRNFTKTAQMLLEEARLPDSHHTPVDAPQGFLFEWWVVFWDFFMAKTGEASGGTQNAHFFLWQHGQKQSTPFPLGPIPGQQNNFGSATSVPTGPGGAGSAIQHPNQAPFAAPINHLPPHQQTNAFSQHQNPAALPPHHQPPPQHPGAQGLSTPHDPNQPFGVAPLMGPGAHTPNHPAQSYRPGVPGNAGPPGSSYPGAPPQPYNNTPNIGRPPQGGHMPARTSLGGSAPPQSGPGGPQSMDWNASAPQDRGNPSLSSRAPSAGPSVPGRPGSAAPGQSAPATPAMGNANPLGDGSNFDPNVHHNPAYAAELRRQQHQQASIQAQQQSNSANSQFNAMAAQRAAAQAPNGPGQHQTAPGAQNGTQGPASYVQPYPPVPGANQQQQQFEGRPGSSGGPQQPYSGMPGGHQPQSGQQGPHSLQPGAHMQQGAPQQGAHGMPNYLNNQLYGSAPGVPGQMMRPGIGRGMPPPNQLPMQYGVTAQQQHFPPGHPNATNRIVNGPAGQRFGPGGPPQHPGQQQPTHLYGQPGQQPQPNPNHMLYQQQQQQSPHSVGPGGAQPPHPAAQGGYGAPSGVNMNSVPIGGTGGILPTSTPGPAPPQTPTSQAGSNTPFQGSVPMPGAPNAGGSRAPTPASQAGHNVSTPAQQHANIPHQSPLRGPGGAPQQNVPGSRPASSPAPNPGLDNSHHSQTRSLSGTLRSVPGPAGSAFNHGQGPSHVGVKRPGSPNNEADPTKGNTPPDAKRARHEQGPSQNGVPSSSPRAPFIPPPPSRNGPQAMVAQGSPAVNQITALQSKRGASAAALGQPSALPTLNKPMEGGNPMTNASAAASGKAANGPAGLKGRLTGRGRGLNAGPQKAGAAAGTAGPSSTATASTSSPTNRGAMLPPSTVHASPLGRDRPKDNQSVLSNAQKEAEQAPRADAASSNGGAPNTSPASEKIAAATISPSAITNAPQLMDSLEESSPSLRPSPSTSGGTSAASLPQNFAAVQSTHPAVNVAGAPVFDYGELFNLGDVSSLYPSDLYGGDFGDSNTMLSGGDIFNNYFDPQKFESGEDDLNAASFL